MMKLFLVILVLFVGLGESAAADKPRVLSDYMSSEYVGVPLINAALPQQALTKRDVDRWGRLLNASEAQTHFMHLQYKRFVQQHNEYMDSQIEAYVEASTSLSNTRGSGSYDQAYVEGLRSLRNRSERTCRALALIEHEYVDALAPILTNDQRQWLSTLRLEGTRRSFRTFSNRVRWADVELRQMWDTIDSDVALAVQVEVLEILAEYEEQLTPFVRNQAEAHWDRPIQIVPLLMRYNDGQVSDSGFTAAYRRIHGRFLNAGLSIRALTDATLNRLQEVLPSSASQALLQQVKQHVYPELYPDRTSLHDLFAAILVSEEMRDEWIQYVEPLFAEYQDRYVQICDRMEALCMEWSDGSAAGNSEYHSADFSDALEPFLNDRRAIAATTMQTLKDLVGGAFLESYAHLIPSSLIEVDPE